MCARWAMKDCRKADGSRVGVKNHCAEGQCEVKQSGGGWGGFVIYECTKCGCYEGL